MSQYGTRTRPCSYVTSSKRERAKVILWKKTEKEKELG